MVINTCCTIPPTHVSFKPEEGAHYNLTTAPEEEAMSAPNISVRFWGTRGSIPAPLTGVQVEAKVKAALQHSLTEPLPTNPDELDAWMQSNLPFEVRSTYGGNTTCIEVRLDDVLLILDMGSGLRELGNALKPEIFMNKGMKAVVLQSHVHWDHIQGFPFFSPIFMPQSMFKNELTFYGGRDWDKDLDKVLHGQMEAPVFPVDLGELMHTGAKMKFNAVYDGLAFEIPNVRGPVKIMCRKLNHPQETYGYRIEYRDFVIAFTTDHEAYTAPHNNLVQIARGANIWITECQYSFAEYAGHLPYRIQKTGWGHSYPEYLAAVAALALPESIWTMHHDPESPDTRVKELADQLGQLSGIKSAAAYEGLILQA